MTPAVSPLESGRCADFFSLDLGSIEYAGALHDPVAATVFRAPTRARLTVVHGRVVVEDGYTRPGPTEERPRPATAQTRCSGTDMRRSTSRKAGSSFDGAKRGSQAAWMTKPECSRAAVSSHSRARCLSPSPSYATAMS